MEMTELTPQTCVGPHVARYIGPHAGIRCLRCNIPVRPDPRVTETATRFASPNLEATAAAVNARGSVCTRCGHWTFRPARVMTQGGRPAETDGLCHNCADLTGEQADEPELCLGCGEPRNKGAHGVDQGFGGCV